MAKKTKKPALEPIYNPAEPVYIIGGGASLASFKWSALQGKQTMAINTAHRKLSNANAMMFSDAQFYKQWGDVHEKDDFWRFKGHVYSTLDAIKGHKRIKHVNIGVDGNTGVKAIALAEMLGASVVVLLGFDGTSGHWHDGTSLQHSGSTAKGAYARYIKEFESYAKSNKGLRVINTNPNSAIDCFEFMDLNEALQLNTNQE